MGLEWIHRSATRSRPEGSPSSEFGGQDAHTARGTIVDAITAPRSVADPEDRPVAAPKAQHSRGRHAVTKVAEARVKRFGSERHFQNEMMAYMALGDSGVTPHLISSDPKTHVLEIEEYGRALNELHGSDRRAAAHQIFDALASMHMRGVVHRDFHGRNILIGPRGPRVVDFEWSHTGYMPLIDSPDIVRSPRPEFFHPGYASFWNDGTEYSLISLTKLDGLAVYEAYLDRLRAEVRRVSGFKTNSSFKRAGLVYQSIPALGISDDQAQRKTTRRFEWMGLDKIVSGAEVMDLGCNMGAMSVMCAEAGATKVVGVELDPGRCEIGRRISAVAGVHDRVSFHNVDILESLRPLEATGFGGVILALAVDAWVSSAPEFYRLLGACKPEVLVLESNKILKPEPLRKIFAPYFRSFEVLGSTKDEDAFSNHRLVVVMRGPR